MNESELNQDLEDDAPSRSQLKREATEQQQLGRKLTTYNPGFLQKLPLPDRLIAAINEYNRLPNKHGAKRRQLQFIGKLMRDCDFDQITSQIDRLENPRQGIDQSIDRKQQELQEYCDNILQTGDTAITQLLEKHPQLERQSLRQLYREHHHATEQSKLKIRKRLLTQLRSHLYNLS